MEKKIQKKTDHEAYRRALLEGVVKAGAKYDIGGITNKTISEMSGQPESYIYRYFIDRDDLIQKAFFRSDENFFEELTKNSPILFDMLLSPQERFNKFMDVSWNYMVEDFTYCKFFIRYYHSSANTKEFRVKHKEIEWRFFSHIRTLFTEEMNVDMAMHQMFAVVLWSIMDIAMGIKQNTRGNREKLFSWMFEMIQPYLKRNLK